MSPSCLGEAKLQSSVMFFKISHKFASQQLGIPWWLRGSQIVDGFLPLLERVESVLGFSVFVASLGSTTLNTQLTRHLTRHTHNTGQAASGKKLSTSRQAIGTRQAMRTRQTASARQVISTRQVAAARLEANIRPTDNCR